MEERKTAAIVLSVLSLIGIIIVYCHNRSEQTLSFNSCAVKIGYFGKGYEVDEFRVAKNKLAICLCNLYKKKPDTAASKEIMSIYLQYGNHSANDSLTYRPSNNLDSIIKNISMAFDTTILVG